MYFKYVEIIDMITVSINFLINISIFILSADKTLYFLFIVFSINHCRYLYGELFGLFQMKPCLNCY
jgi:hypothetical protein